MQCFEIPGIAAALGESSGGALDVANVFERFAEFGKEVGFSEELFNGVEARIKFGEVFEWMKEPVAKLTCTHGSSGAVEGRKEGVLGARAGLYEVEIELRGSIDEHVFAMIADAQGGEVVAVAA